MGQLKGGVKVKGIIFTRNAYNRQILEIKRSDSNHQEAR